jgi:hypothetical protein
MPEAEKKSWLRRRAEGAIRGGLTRAYETVRVDPTRFLMQLRVAYGLPIASFRGVHTLQVQQLDEVAESVIRSGMKMAAAEGPALIGRIYHHCAGSRHLVSGSPCGRFRSSAYLRLPR